MWTFDELRERIKPLAKQASLGAFGKEHARRSGYFCGLRYFTIILNLHFKLKRDPQISAAGEDADTSTAAGVLSVETYYCEPLADDLMWMGGRVARICCEFRNLAKAAVVGISDVIDLDQLFWRWVDASAGAQLWLRGANWALFDFSSKTQMGLDVTWTELHCPPWHWATRKERTSSGNQNTYSCPGATGICQWTFDGHYQFLSAQVLTWVGNAIIMIAALISDTRSMNRLNHVSKR